MKGMTGHMVVSSYLSTPTTWWYVKHCKASIYYDIASGAYIGVLKNQSAFVSNNLAFMGLS